MNLHWIDWVIVVSFFGFITAVVTYTRRYTKSVADFLSANRCAGRYLLTVSGDMANLAAIAIVANFQLYYQAGCTVTWWQTMAMPTGIIVAVSGFVIYRFRQTRAMTLAQFFEMRYSKNFRIFAGFLIVASGILNFGIFPAVGAKFFITFCGFSASFSVAGLSIPTYPSVMAVLLAISLYFTYIGGQIAITITDFIQGFFCSFVLIVITLIIFFTVGWGRIEEVLLRPENVHMIDPFRGRNIPDFNVWFFVMGIILTLYTTRAWQGSQGFNSSALSPHEAKMGGIISTLRYMGGAAMAFIIPIGVYALLRHPDFAVLTATSNAALNSIADEQTRNQMIVPIVMSKMLSVGMMGCFVAVILAAFIANHQAYMHSWGSIFVQDVIMPFRKKPFSAKQHMHLLRLSMLGVVVFIFIFSLIWRQTEAILLWLQITGAIYMGGAGAVVIGGLYWKKGTTAAAYSSLIAGSILAVAGITIKQVSPHFFLNGMQISFIAAFIACLIYVLVSLLNPKDNYDLDKLLHHGKYAVGDDNVAVGIEVGGKNRWEIFWSKLGLTNEFSKGDRVIFFSVYAFACFWLTIFIAGILYHIIFGTDASFWMRYWRYYVFLSVPLSIGFAVWLCVGGILDTRKMFKRLRTLDRDEHDDGFVRDDSKTISPDGQLSGIVATENDK